MLEEQFRIFLFHIISFAVLKDFTRTSKYVFWKDTEQESK